jgi:hypothetical protein
MSYQKSFIANPDVPIVHVTFSDVFFHSFIDVRHVPVRKIDETAAEIKVLYALLQPRMYLPELSRDQKAELMRYLAELKEALEDLDIRKGTRDPAAMKRAASHLAKKMQSSVGGTELEPATKTGMSKHRMLAEGINRISNTGSPEMKSSFTVKENPVTVVVAPSASSIKAGSPEMPTASRVKARKKAPALARP